MKKELIICNLKQLSSYITKDIQICDSGIEHWKSRIRTYGADAKIYGAGTYEECLQSDIKTKEGLERQLKANEKLIWKLEEMEDAQDER